jgi:hypothetical protein
MRRESSSATAGVVGGLPVGGVGVGGDGVGGDGEIGPPAPQLL